MLERLEVLRTRLWGLIMPVLIGIFVLIIAGMGIVYFQQRRVQGSLQPQINQIRETVLNTVHITDELRTEYAEALDAIPTELETDDVIEIVLGIAEANGFDVSVDSSDIDAIIPEDSPRKEKIRGTEYQVFVFEMTISGEYTKLMGFVQDMDSTTELMTMVIQTLKLQKMDQTEVTAILTFGVYTLAS